MNISYLPWALVGLTAIVGCSSSGTNTLPVGTGGGTFVAGQGGGTGLGTGTGVITPGGGATAITTGVITPGGGATAITTGAGTTPGGGTTGASTSTGTIAKGGTTGTGTTAKGGTTGTGTTAKGGSTSTSTDPLGGYHVHGDWAGFAFTFATEATITPIATVGYKTMVNSDGPYCVKGTVAGTTAYTSIAAVGVNAKQVKEHDATAQGTVSTGTGLMVHIASTMTTTLRVQIEDGTDPAAADAPLHRWCSNVSSTDFNKDLVIPWASFNTECWAGGKGTAFNPTTAVVKAIVYLPDNGKTEQSFDFCLNDIGPENVTGRGTGSIVPSCGNTVSWPSTSITDKFAKIKSTDGAYAFQSNGWNWVNGSHSASLLSSCGFKMDTQTCKSGDSRPCSFPSVYIGTNSGGDSRTTGNGLPKQVSTIASAPTCLGWTAGGAPNEYNVAFDVWFNSTSSASSADTFLMLWYHKPDSFQPAGAPVADGIVIGGQIWTVWYGPNADGQPVVSYMAPNDLAKGQAYSFDLKDFIDDAVARKYIATSKYLIAVMGGLEIWGGGAGASISSFKSEVK